MNLTMKLGCHFWPLHYHEIKWCGILDGDSWVSSPSSEPYQRTWYSGLLVFWRCPTILWTTDTSRRFWCEFVARRLLFWLLSSRWLCWDPSAVVLLIEIVFAKPYSPIDRTWSRTSITLKGQVVRGIKLSYSADNWRSDDNTWTLAALRRSLCQAWKKVSSWLSSQNKAYNELVGEPMFHWPSGA